MWTGRLVFLWLFAAAVVCTDLRHRRVPNRLILSAAAGGAVLAAAGGLASLRTGLAGMALGFMLLFPPFLLRMVGGGDVKSLAVVGLAAGPGLLWVSFLCGTAAGGAAALVILGMRRWRRGRKRPDGRRDGATARTLPYAGILCASAAVSALLASL